MRRGSTNQFAPHKHPRTWFITAATSPVGLAVTKQLIDHGDTVIAGVQPDGIEVDDGRDDEFHSFIDDMRRRNDAHNRLTTMPFNSKLVFTLQLNRTRTDL